MRKIATLSKPSGFLSPALVVATLTASSVASFAIDALSPVERFLGDGFDPDEYSDQNLDQQKRFAPTSPGDSDLGDQLILKRYQGRAPLRFDIATHLFWTDNVASTRSNEDDGVIWKTRAAASWKPRIGDNLFADFSITQSIYRYDSPSRLDFERTDGRVGLVKIVPEFFDMLFFARYEYARVTSGSLSDGIYNSHRLRVGAHKVFLSTPKHTAYVALDYAYDLNTKPSRLERDEYSAHLGYTYQITDDLKAVFFYHLALYDYDQAGRDDVNQVAGAELYWQLNRSARVHASLLYAENDSNLSDGAADYSAFQGGLGLGMTFNF
ncbi:outer membrane beta-barrel protein [Verrucomicrobiaceae bacterium R5-34]|uniref:Outer membrane beta-barrel protein n=1 Tax=Oceaniferula flava TaxID=2800421 RepID=A0AAE2SC02_9BACT|nr:outer membrane beta-barrel protein [Oceaniferula flavus]MBK1831524.1 outer membrane beta-barrel protein [Verrucomicrobiaceae bacterium R5-34]MBK1854237.1 outer membrane beta-barrel protein [Oceaniferula flavus]MBM1135543.1 outer membrane beta-barrel protein [Oceaniferula flavus]